MELRRVVLLALLGSAPAWSADGFAADAANGERIARRWCAECHVVAPEQTSAKADVPSFASIATRNGTSVPLDKFLLNPHPKMPDMQLSRAAIADIVAYIGTLKK